MLNKISGYFRSAVDLKGGFKAVAKAVVFMYTSIAFKFIGDRIALYLGNFKYLILNIAILAFFLYTPISKRSEANKDKADEDDKKANEIKDKLFAKILSKIPKYSDIR